MDSIWLLPSFVLSLAPAAHSLSHAHHTRTVSFHALILFRLIAWFTLDQYSLGFIIMSLNFISVIQRHHLTSFIAWSVVKILALLSLSLLSLKLLNPSQLCFLFSGTIFEKWYVFILRQQFAKAERKWLTRKSGTGKGKGAAKTLKQGKWISD